MIIRRLKYIMADRDMYYSHDGNFIDHLRRFQGETVTIFTNSGGESGSGFTGVLTVVDCSYVRLVTAIASAPECSLGNSCDFCDGFDGGFRRGSFGRGRRGFGRGFGRSFGLGFGRGFGLGSVVDIPISSIASFVHNTL